MLAIDQTIEEKNGQKVVVGKTATLELKPEQAENLARSRQSGTLSLALRALADANAPEMNTGRRPRQQARFRQRGPLRRADHNHDGEVMRTRSDDPPDNTSPDEVRFDAGAVTRHGALRLLLQPVAPVGCGRVARRGAQAATASSMRASCRSASASRS